MDGGVDLTLLASAPAQMAAIVAVVALLKGFLVAVGVSDEAVSGAAPLLALLVGPVVGCCAALALRSDPSVGAGAGLFYGLISTGGYRLAKVTAGGTKKPPAG